MECFSGVVKNLLFKILQRFIAQFFWLSNQRQTRGLDVIKICIFKNQTIYCIYNIYEQKLLTDNKKLESLFLLASLIKFIIQSELFNHDDFPVCLIFAELT